MAFLRFKRVFFLGREGIPLTIKLHVKRHLRIQRFTKSPSMKSVVSGSSADVCVSQWHTYV